MSDVGRWLANRRAVLRTAVVSVLAVTGVGGSAAAAGSTMQILRPKTGRRYPGVGLLLTPAPEHVVPKVTATDAITAFATRWSWPGGTAPRAELFIGSDGQFGPDGGPGESVTFRNRLVWLLSWRSVEETIHGPANLTKADRDRIRRGLIITGYGVMDATTAKSLMIFSASRALA